MSHFIDKKLILNEIKTLYKFKKDTDFARFLEIKPQTLASWYVRNNFDIDLVYKKCPNINADWLLSGKGEKSKYVKNNFETEKSNHEIKLLEKQLEISEQKNLLQNERLKEKSKKIETSIEEIKKLKEIINNNGLVYNDDVFNF